MVLSEFYKYQNSKYTHFVRKIGYSKVSKNKCKENMKSSLQTPQPVLGTNQPDEWTIYREDTQDWTISDELGTRHLNIDEAVNKTLEYNYTYTALRDSLNDRTTND